jgi:hypothetical protein
MGELSLDRMDLPRRAYKDIILACCDCHKQFIFDVLQQQQWDIKGYEAPLRCRNCRRLSRLLKDVWEENEV